MSSLSLRSRQTTHHCSLIQRQATFLAFWKDERLALNIQAGSRG